VDRPVQFYAIEGNQMTGSLEKLSRHFGWLLGKGCESHNQFETVGRWYWMLLTTVF